MIIIDGSYGEGGGQILRTSLALSMITGKPFRIDNIRAGRRRSGLMRQHLAAVNAATEIAHGTVTGNDIGSLQLTFKPGKTRAGNFHFAIGTAGSCTLVLQTILPALMTAQGPSEIILEGGTHNPFAPPFDFLDRVFLPLVNKMGPTLRTRLERPGFYPAGGGRFTVSITPCNTLKRLDLSERGNIIHQKACALVAHIPVSIAKRELTVVKNKLLWEKECLHAIEVDNSQGPGNIFTLEIHSENVTELFTGFGEKGIKAERVAEKAVKSAKEYLARDVPVGRYLADQLLIPLAMAGAGTFRTLSPSKHTVTNIEIIKKFLEVAILMREFEPDIWEIKIS